MDSGCGVLVMYEVRSLMGMSHIYHPEIGAIPNDPENRHYAEYLEWVAQGNTPTKVDISYETPSAD